MRESGRRAMRAERLHAGDEVQNVRVSVSLFTHVCKMLNVTITRVSLYFSSLITPLLLRSFSQCVIIISTYRIELLLAMHDLAQLLISHGS